MKIIRSPNLRPGEESVSIRLVSEPVQNFARGGLARAAEKVRAAGRYGDDMLVHMNKQEFEQLRAAWGEPHYHPHTKMPEYFDWLGLAKAAIPVVTGLFSKKASIDQANQNLAPPTDPNMNRPLGNFTNSRQYIPQKPESPQSYYTYGQPGPNAGETSFYKNNGLSHVTGVIPAPLQGPKQSSPSGGALALGSLGGTALSYLSEHPELLKKWFGGNPPVGADGKPIDTNMGNPDTSRLPSDSYGGLDQAAGAGAGGAAAAAASSIPWDFGPQAALHGSISLAEMSPAEAYAAEMASLDAPLSALGGGAAGAAGGAAAGAAGGAGAAGAGAAGSSLLPGSVAGSSMADTAAYTPAMMEASSPGASAGLGATLGGVGMGLGAFGVGYLASRALAGTGKMSDADWVKKNTGNYATDNDQYQAALKGGDTGTAFTHATAMGESAFSAAQHYAAMGDQANAAKWTAIYKQLTGPGSWYNTQLVARSGGATSGQHGSKTSKLLARGGLAMAMGGPVPTGMMGPQMQLPSPTAAPVAPPAAQPGIMHMQNTGALKPGAFGVGAPGLQQANPIRPSGMFPINPSQGQPGLPPPGGMPPPSWHPPVGIGAPPPVIAPQRPPMGGLGMAGGMGQRFGQFDRRSSGGAIRGPGTGTSDDIPARLSDGEYVIPAHVVAALGDGSTEAGAKRLDQLQHQVRKMTGRQMAAGRHPKPAPPPLALLGSMK